MGKERADEPRLEIRRDGFKTDEQRQAAEELIEHWPISLTEMAEKGEYSRQHYANVLKEYLQEIGQSTSPASHLARGSEMDDTQAYQEGYRDGYRDGWKDAMEELAGE